MQREYSQAFGTKIVSLICDGTSPMSRFVFLLFGTQQEAVFIRVWVLDAVQIACTQLKLASAVKTLLEKVMKAGLVCHVCTDAHFKAERRFYFYARDSGIASLEYVCQAFF